jgi:threonylcarbamoyladenosine tRNA methylthiotransferase MtaB
VDGSRADSVALLSLGCRVGRADAGSIAAGLPPGFREAAPGESPAWVVVSTCSVTADAAASSRQAVRRAAREHPGARIVVAGCHAPGEEADLAVIPGVAAVVGPGDHAALPALLERLRAGEAPPVALLAARRSAPAWVASPRPGDGPARPVLKIQDGCDGACAYCAVPLFRGSSRSLPLRDCLDRIAAHGALRPEVVLSGVHLGGWGRDLSPRHSLADLIRAAAAEGSVHRLRLSSIEPLELPVELLSEEAGALLCEHFHLPMQSGSDRVLASMGRPYRAGDYARIVEALARARPGAAIGADVMSGFPGETEEDHRATLALLASLPIASLHVFPFSPRPGTPAARMGGRPRADVVARRAAELRALSARRRTAFQAGLLGRELEVVVERVRGPVAEGTSRENETVRFLSRDAVRGTIARVRAGDEGVRVGRGVAGAAAPS